MTPPIARLVLDGQGVVFTDPFAGFLDDLARATGQEPARVRTRWRDELRDPCWRGELPETALWDRLTDGAPGEWRDELEQRYTAGPAAVALPRWSAQVPVWLLSNHRGAWLFPRLERLGLRRYFAEVVVSDAIGALKPEATAFAAAFAGIDDPARVLVVDDQRKNVDAARALGAVAVLAQPAIAWREAVDARLGVTSV